MVQQTQITAFAGLTGFALTGLPASSQATAQEADDITSGIISSSINNDAPRGQPHSTTGHAAPVTVPLPGPGALAESASTMTEWMVIQERLAAPSHAPGPVDGISRGLTRDAVARFRVHCGADTTGCLTPGQRTGLPTPVDPFAARSSSGNAVTAPTRPSPLGVPTLEWTQAPPGGDPAT